jgi:hypothetical protein
LQKYLKKTYGILAPEQILRIHLHVIHAFCVLSVQGKDTYTTALHFESSTKHLRYKQITCLRTRFIITHYCTHPPVPPFFS